jgi:hypothetical protein
VHVDCLRGPLDMQHATNTHVFSFATHESTLDKSLDLNPTLSGSRSRQHGSAVKFTCFNALAVCLVARDERNRRGRTQQHHEEHEPLARPSLQCCHSPNTQIQECTAYANFGTSTFLVLRSTTVCFFSPSGSTRFAFVARCSFAAAQFGRPIKATYAQEIDQQSDLRSA